MFTASQAGGEHLMAMLGFLILRASEPQPLLQDAADKIEQLTAARFTDEGPGWAELAVSTQRDRAARGFPPAHPILVRTGVLRASATAKGGGGGRRHIRRLSGSRAIEVGTSLPYAQFHQFGTSRMPARPIYQITPADAAVFRVAAVDYLLGRWEKNPAAGVIAA